MMLTIALSVAVGLLVMLTFARKRIAELKVENHRLSKQADELPRMKKDFVSYVSHELKAPLASMQETTHLLLERIPGPLTEKQKRLLDLNFQSGKRLSGMIGNLLELSRLQAGVVEYDIQSQDLGELVQNVIGNHSVMAAEEKIEILVNVPPIPLTVRCDATRIMQLLGNVLENALRFSPEGSVVTMEARSVNELPPEMPSAVQSTMLARKSPAGFALVSVADSGPGIDDSNKENVFDTFHRLSQARKTHNQNLGLGLVIARILVEHHEGAIWVKNNSPAGSVFCVALPQLEGDPGSRASRPPLSVVR